MLWGFYEFLPLWQFIKSSINHIYFWRVYFFSTGKRCAGGPKKMGESYFLSDDSQVLPNHLIYTCLEAESCKEKSIESENYKTKLNIARKNRYYYFTLSISKKKIKNWFEFIPSWANISKFPLGSPDIWPPSSHRELVNLKLKQSSLSLQSKAH